eukprot:scaffold120479_cov33-Tisochrysis_lutea.AAC.2
MLCGGEAEGQDECACTRCRGRGGLLGLVFCAPSLLDQEKGNTLKDLLLISRMPKRELCAATRASVQP